MYEFSDYNEETFETREDALLARLVHWSRYPHEKRRITIAEIEGEKFVLLFHNEAI